jgi:hypothetical protein
LEPKHVIAAAQVTLPKCAPGFLGTRYKVTTIAGLLGKKNFTMIKVTRY